MKKLSIFCFAFILFAIFLTTNLAIAQVIPPKARGTSSGGPTIDEAQKEDAMGPKARVAVSRFVDKSAKGKSSGQIGERMAEMLTNALFASNRFIVLERQTSVTFFRNNISEHQGASGQKRLLDSVRLYVDSHRIPRKGWGKPGTESLNESMLLALVALARS